MDQRKLVENIIACKIDVLERSTFFGLLMHSLIFAVDTQCPTACTDGERVYFGQAFCEDMPRDELEVVMLHELMHVVLGHCFRGRGYNQLLYNIAADIVVNSTILHTLGLDVTVKGTELIHLAPNGKEGYLYTAEDVYKMLLDTLKPRKSGKKRKKSDTAGGPMGDDEGEGGNEQTDADDANGDSRSGGTRGENEANAKDGTGDWHEDYDTSAYDEGRLDDHSRWSEVSAAAKAEWQGRIMDAAKTTMEQGVHAGKGAELAKRYYDELTRPTIDWRLLLQNFIQTDVTDYSFMPPDRRFADVFLPDFNEPTDTVKNLWLVMDTSGSISNADMARAFSEIKGGIDQFGGALSGKLSFFDAKVTEPVDFETFEDVRKIIPRGGGGTNFHAVFDYFRKHLYEKEEITGIIIFTDGYAVFPPESMALDTPVFWLVNNRLVTPPWGIVARYLPETK